MTIERAAKALRSKAAEIENRQDGGDADAMWFADEFSRAALEAIAEPTKEMIEAGSKKFSASIRYYGETFPNIIASDIWRAMHAAMLKDWKSVK